MVSNSEGSFAGLATYVLVCWTIMVALLLNMSYLTMVAMHGKAATWVGPSDPSPPKKNTKNKKQKKLEEQKQTLFLQKARDYYMPPGPSDFQNFLRPCWGWEGHHRRAATGRWRGRRGPTTFWWLLKSLRCLEIISAHRNCSQGTAQHSTYWVTWLVHWLVRRRRHYFWANFVTNRPKIVEFGYSDRF